MQAGNFIKKETLCHRCFTVNFVKFLNTPFLQNTSGRLLLEFDESTGFMITCSIVCLLNTRPNNKYSCLIWKYWNYINSNGEEEYYNTEHLFQKRHCKKMKFSIKDFFSKCDLVTFTEEILYEKLHLCAMRTLKN